MPFSYAHPFFLFRILLLPAVIAFLYLYFFPAINDCAFPPAQKVRTRCSASGECKNSTVSAGTAPFRLLALADPQLEGDSSLPAGWDGTSYGLGRAWEHAIAGRWDDLGVMAQAYRKKVDLWGNDWYLAHIYRQTRWWAMPTHTVVLGDLLGSQWIGDEEFARRADRFWNTVFGSAHGVPYNVMAADHEMEILGKTKDWKRRIIAVAGNHDIGYAGDLSEERIERFEKSFGRVNWEIRFQLPNATLKTEQDFPSKKNLDFYETIGKQPELRLVILNSMNLDEPARSPVSREQSLDFLSNSICNPDRFEDENAATVLLTHIPFHKPSGICVDGPFFDYFSSEHGGGIHEQNHLSEDTSRRILDCLSQSQPAIVLNGHDHEGCDTHHYVSPSKADDRKVVHHNNLISLSAEEKASALREITVRSMMGAYGGYAGFLSGWFDPVKEQWDFEYETCGFGVQHIWWVCNIVLLFTIGLGVISVADAFARSYFEPETEIKVKEE